MLLLLTFAPAHVAAADCAARGPGANLATCGLSGLDLGGIDFTGANLRAANLGGANLAGANLAGANLHDAILTGANLTGANFSGANLSRATVTEGALDNADTSGANLHGIIWVSAPPAVDTPRLTIHTVRTGTSIWGDPMIHVSVSGEGLMPGSTVSFTGEVFGIADVPPYVESTTVPDSGALDWGIGTWDCALLPVYTATGTGHDGSAVSTTVGYLDGICDG
jgi:uncharacterized protein YjbI with pentapeptide repeats